MENRQGDRIPRARVSGVHSWFLQALRTEVRSGVCGGVAGERVVAGGLLLPEQTVAVRSRGTSVRATERLLCSGDLLRYGVDERSVVRAIVRRVFVGVDYRHGAAVCTLGERRLVVVGPMRADASVCVAMFPGGGAGTLDVADADAGIGMQCAVLCRSDGRSDR